MLSKIKTILIATDFSESSDNAFRVGISAAGNTRNKLR